MASLMSLTSMLGVGVNDQLQNTWDAWAGLTEWYGAHSELKPPPGYVAWKGELYAQSVDPRLRRFFYPGARHTVRVEEAVWGGVKVDGIPALVDPPMLPAGQAHYLTEAEPVFGVSINGDHRAYPLRILDRHEMANDVVGGRAVALSYCTLCGSGILYDSSFGGKAHRFGSSGMLFRSNKLMYDRTTYTLWNQLTGEPVIGKLAGSGVRLEVLPMVVSSWGRWKREHPDTLVLDPNTGYGRPYTLGASYGSYFASSEKMFPVWRHGGVLPDKTVVFALRVGTRENAWPLEALGAAGGVVNDIVGSQPLVVVSSEPVGRVALPESWRRALVGLGKPYAKIDSANALSLEAARAVLKADPQLAAKLTADILLATPAQVRLALLSELTRSGRAGSQAPAGMLAPDLRNQVAERGLIGEVRAYRRGPHTFHPASLEGRLLDERGKSWCVSEAALVSPAGERLARLPGHLAFWFAWYAFYPQTGVYGVQPAPAGAVKAGAGPPANRP